MILGTISFLAGLACGWILFRSERAYGEGWRDGERHGRIEGFKAALRKLRSPLLNPRTGDWYDK